MPASVESLDTVSDASDDSEYDYLEELEAQREWEESLEQLQQLFAVVLFPYLGKWLGRRWSHWGTPFISCPLSSAPYCRLIHSHPSRSLCQIRTPWVHKVVLSR